MIAAAMPVVTIRAAKPAEIGALDALIVASARALGRGFYSAAETEAAIAGVFGVDSELIEDGTYLVAMLDGTIAGCGGWSRRRTLFGGDGYGAREEGFLDPAIDAARIRAFFVDPDRARAGIGSALLAACEAAAAGAGFAETALMATLPGVPFYAAHGYREAPPVTLDLAGTPVRFIPMSKRIVAFG